MRCPFCGTLLNRRIDLQCLIVTFFIGGTSFVLVFLFALHHYALGAIAIAAIALMWVVDVFTVRLVEAGRFRGLLGYEA
jgi:hypothetical protein